MRRFLFTLALATTILAAAAWPQQPSFTVTVRVRKGTYLKLETLSALDPTTARPGDDVPLRLMRPLYIEGATLLPEGELLHGVITRVKQAGRRCRSGEVGWKLEKIAFADGSKVRTHVRFKTSRRNDHVALEKSKPSSGPGGRAGVIEQNIILAPFMAAGLVELGAIKLLKKPFQDGSCSRYTRDPPLPAHSTIVLEVVEDHMVRY